MDFRHPGLRENQCLCAGNLFKQPQEAHTAALMVASLHHPSAAGGDSPGGLQRPPLTCQSPCICPPAAFQGETRGALSLQAAHPCSCLSPEVPGLLPPTSGCRRPPATFPRLPAWLPGHRCPFVPSAGLIYCFTEVSRNLGDQLVTCPHSTDQKETRRGQGPQPLAPRPHRVSEGQTAGLVAPRTRPSGCTTSPPWLSAESSTAPGS